MNMNTIHTNHHELIIGYLAFKSGRVGRGRGHEPEERHDTPPFDIEEHRACHARLTVEIHPGALHAVDMAIEYDGRPRRYLRVCRYAVAFPPAIRASKTRSLSASATTLVAKRFASICVPACRHISPTNERAPPRVASRARRSQLLAPCSRSRAFRAARRRGGARAPGCVRSRSEGRRHSIPKARRGRRETLTRRARCPARSAQRRDDCRHIAASARQVAASASSAQRHFAVSRAPSARETCVDADAAARSALLTPPRCGGPSSGARSHVARWSCTYSRTVRRQPPTEKTIERRVHALGLPKPEPRVEDHLNANLRPRRAAAVQVPRVAQDRCGLVTNRSTDRFRRCERGGREVDRLGAGERVRAPIVRGR